MALLDNLKIGDTVEFRSGGKAIAGEVRNNKNSYFSVIIVFNCGSSDSYTFSGSRYFIQDDIHDIVKVIPVPHFDWATAKIGMAFEGRSRIVHFVGFDRQGNIYTKIESNSIIVPHEKSELIRAPIYDRELW